MRQTTLNKLNAKAAKALGDGYHGDGGGLFLRIKGNSRSWVFRYTAEGKKREKAIGPAASISLASARQRAAEAREALAEGQPPVTRKPAPAPVPAAPKAKTLDEVARDYIAARRATWSNAKHAAQWHASLDLHAAKLLAMPIDQITTADVSDCLSPIWLAKMETAGRVRQRIERILGAAIARGDRSGPNPAALRDNLDQIRPVFAACAASDAAQGAKRLSGGRIQATLASEGTATWGMSAYGIYREKF